jgi:hypothetical protein
MPLPLYFRGPQAGLPNRGRMLVGRQEQGRRKESGVGGQRCDRMDHCKSPCCLRSAALENRGASTRAGA